MQGNGGNAGKILSGPGTFSVENASIEGGDGEGGPAGLEQLRNDAKMMQL